MRTVYRTIGIVLWALYVHGQASAQPQIGPALRIDPGTSSIRWALEYSAVADQHSAAMIWMKQPQAESPFQKHTFARAFSNDCGTTWGVEYFQGTTDGEFDPQSAVDGRTGNMWVGGYAKRDPQEFPNDLLFVARRSTGAASWGTTAIVVAATNVGDKQWMAAGRRPDDANTTRLYMSVRGSSVGEGIAWSDSLGDANTWSAPLEVLEGIGPWHPRVGALGELYVGGKADDEGDALLARSFELVSAGGAPKFDFTAHPVSTVASPIQGSVSSDVPGSFRVINLPIIAVDPTQSKRVYCAYVRSEPFTEPEVNRDVDICIRKTDDASDQTIDWGDEIRLDIEGDQFFPWIECDEHGRVHLLFMDSRNDLDQSDSETVHGFFDVYYAYSVDEGETWTHIRLTDQMFDVDAADDNPEDENPCDFFGDYLGMGVAKHRVYPACGATADGRTEAMTRCIVFGENASREDIDATAGTLISGGLTEISTSDDSRAIVRDVSGGVFDPVMIAMARELRDRYLEQVNSGAIELPCNGKYDVSRRMVEGVEVLGLGGSTADQVDVRALAA